MRETTINTETDVRVTVRGTLPGAGEHARDRVMESLGHAPKPVLDARVRVTEQRDPTRERRVVAQANVRLRGRAVRAQAAAATVAGAVDELCERLRTRLAKSSTRWEARRGRWPHPGSWRHGSERSARPAFFPRPEEECQIVRHKAFTLAACSVDEAADEMDSMDYAFHLFVENTTGQDSVLYRTPDGYRLAQVRPVPEEIPQTGVSLTVSEHPAVRLPVTEAITRLTMSEMPFVFFVDTENERGSVLYRRYDGHYGLIAPPA
ncbi:sigma 54 modulation/S30EA ribosomal C-terminal domain-containing protein [Amycolatopsis sp. CA-230715]|uniref:sigma 54 modulation/S30EA ribosomal C-terminal domain-containing protein n=1 Tax=Amycolatopsis sp. CA-230715 TaxID=2745196 RepID=UPI0020B21A3B|nr:sigma 54 modulation/S30EA ribosomal C-terminal domain-containing protein [Amycolatopsis sp. CA-230715]